MKNRWSIFAIAALIFYVGATRAAAQGAQGVGSSGPVTAVGTEKPKSAHSLNPVKWVKKDKKAVGDSSANSDQNTKLSAKLQAAGLLPADRNLKDACAAFKNLSECVAAIHASQNLAINFTCLKWDVTGLQPSADISSCATPGTGAMSLEQAIHILKPNADAKAEAKNARKQAHSDLKETKS